MKILLISRCPPYPLHFGDRLIIWHLARELSQRGHPLDLLALTQLETDASEMDAYAEFFDDIHLFPEAKRTQWMYLKRLLGSHYPNNAESAWQGDMWRAIEQKLAKNHYDLVHLFGGVHVYEFAELLKHLPTIVSPYESYSLYLKREFQQRPNLMTWLNRQITHRFEQWMFSPYDGTVVLTEEDKSELLGINSQLSIDVIPNGIDLDNFQVQSKTRDKATLLFVGNYEYPPNHDAALILATEIFPTVLAAVPEAKLQLVGNAPSDAMKSLKSDQIEVTGRVPSVQDYLASATIFVCPLRVGAGIKNKVLEALAMGIPTLATPLSLEGINAIKDKHVLIAEVDEMAETIINLLNNQRLQQSLSQNARPLIEAKYSWRSVANHYETLYKNIISAHQK